MIDHSCGLPYHDERGEVQDCTRWQPCRKCLETECARLMRETPAAYVLELTEAFPMGDMGSGTMNTRNQAMNLCESCRVYETCKRSWKDGFAAGCEGYRTLTRADLKAVQDQLAELQNGLIVASMDADDHYRDGELAELRSQLTEARKEIEGAKVVIPEPTETDHFAIWSADGPLTLATLAWARQHARIERAT